MNLYLLTATDSDGFHHSDVIRACSKDAALEMWNEPELNPDVVLISPDGPEGVVKLEFI